MTAKHQVNRLGRKRVRATLQSVSLYSVVAQDGTCMLVPSYELFTPVPFARCGGKLCAHRILLCHCIPPVIVKDAASEPSIMAGYARATVMRPRDLRKLV